MPGTQYDRFLDVHLVSSKVKDQTEILADQTSKYQYDFQSDFTSQRRAYVQKLDAKFRDDIAEEVRMARFFGTPAPAAQKTQTLTISHVLGSQGAALPMQNLEPLHYVSCYVDLESLRPGNPPIAELDALVKWVCARQDNSGSPKIGKLRLNCHGAGRANAGLLMGNSNLSPEDLVDSLMRHGLTTRKTQYSSQRQNVVGQAARWKADAEVNACEKCRKGFTILRRKHHCRRCGGIFCDACTTKRRPLKNPLTENGRAAGTVEDCRVCDACAVEADKIVTTEAKAGKGLAQITLAMCLAARTKEEFSVAKTGFVRNSVGQRIARNLSLKGVHGIRVSASNEVVRWDSQGGGLTQCFSLQYPGMSRATKPTSGLVADPFEGTGWAGTVDVGRESVSIPNSVLGGNEADPAIPPIVGDPTYASIRDQKIVPIHGGTAIAFGVFAADRATGRLLEQAYRKWKFDSWSKSEVLVGTIPELTRFATDLEGFKTTNISAGRKGPSLPPVLMKTIMLNSRYRGVTIQRDPKDPARLIVSGFEERRYKDFKVFEVS